MNHENPYITHSDSNGDNDLAHLMQRWQSLGTGESFEKTPDHVMKKLHAAERKLTLPRRLARRYLLSSIIGVAMIPMSFELYRIVPVSIWLCVVYALFGLGMAIPSFILSYKLRNSRYYELPVIEAVRKISQLNRAHQNLEYVGIGCAVAVLSFFFYEIWQTGDMAILTGAIVGLVIGLAIGIARKIRTARNFREWLAIFKEDL
ncbi:MAG: hypothetical protein Q4F07_01360 [Bacteroidales bacterium]|nr:hypothetical protein [Bacteroidales bacterium]